MQKNLPLENPEPDACLESGSFINSSDPAIVAFAQAATTGLDTHISMALALYGKVRDGIIYTPYRPLADMETYRASKCLSDGKGCCIEKSALLAACARAVGIPARVGYADVQNHMSSPRLMELLGTNTFYWHGYTELYLNGRWVKVTPVFDLELCEKIGVHPLDFDGYEDSIFHPLDAKGDKHLEYITMRGTYLDVPAAMIMRDLKRHYPKLIAAYGEVHTDFQQEASANSG